MDRYTIEEIVLSLADIVQENRYLREENKRLHKIEKEYYEYLDERFKASEQASLNMYNALCAGYSVAKENKN
mgnify:CR=1 FL=1